MNSPTGAQGLVSAAVHEEIRALRGGVPELAGSLVASRDGLLVAHDLPRSIEPAAMAALSASELALSSRLSEVFGEGELDEVVIRSTGGYVVLYAAGPSAVLTVITGPGVNVGRLHLESRPVAHSVAVRLAAP